MEMIQELSNIARVRPEFLKKEKQRGRKIIGYTGRFVPEELIVAADAEPYFICRGGDPEPADELLPYMLRIMSPYARAQVGYHLLDLEPVYPMLDLIVAECSDCHMTRLADLFEYFEFPTARLGVPPDWTKDISFDYYHRGLVRLREKIEEVTGNIISNEKLQESTEALNTTRRLLRLIGESRKMHPPPIGGYDVIQLHHHSFYCGRDELADKLKGWEKRLENAGTNYSESAPRLLLAGRVVSVGDYVLEKLIEKVGGVVVAEFLDEGTRFCEWEVATDGDMLRNIAETYYMKRIPPSVFQPAWIERIEYLKKLIGEYRIDGVIWYQLVFEEIYDMESAIVAREMQKMNIPFLKLESSFEYSREAMGPLTTRIESFIESIKRKVGAQHGECI
jgi:benzoyl-CoA reductase/2-hydroxyglutaryl-CoA dehydratase subunit BcrC/BadD/HgdB